MTTAKTIVLSGCILAAAIAGGCERQPVGPSSLAPAMESTSAGLSAKRSGSTPYTSEFSGGISATGSLSGTTSGIDGSPGTLSAEVSGDYTWTIHEADLQLNMPGVANCDGSGINALTEDELVGKAVSGSLSLDANERTSSGERLDFRMTGVAGKAHAWEISGHTTLGYPAIISGNTSAVTVEVPRALIGFKRNPRGKVAADEMITCTVAFTVKIANP